MTGPILPVATPDLDGVTVRRHVLDHEAARLVGIMQRVGKRLSHWLRTHSIHELPDRDALETLKWYSNTVLALLREQRERAKLAKLSGLDELTEAEHAQALEAFRRETMLAMSDEELAKLQAERVRLS